MYVCMHACMQVFMYVCIYVCMYAWKPCECVFYVCTYVCMYVCMYACMKALRVCICAHGVSQLDEDHVNMQRESSTTGRLESDRASFDSRVVVLYAESSHVRISNHTHRMPEVDSAPTNHQC